MSSPSISPVAEQRFRLFEAVFNCNGTPTEADLNEIEEICAAISRARMVELTEPREFVGSEMILTGFKGTVNGSWTVARMDVVHPCGISILLQRSSSASGGAK